MRNFITVLLILTGLGLAGLGLASCASPNGMAAGSHQGASARADIFQIPLP